MNSEITQNQVPVRSEVRTRSGTPMLFINDKPTAAAAYITYFSECAKYGDFISAGYKLFSIPCYFGSLGINTRSGIHPFEPGIFDNPDSADFSVFDGNVKTLLEKSPKAHILPRVDVSMPERWIDENPDELICSDSGIRRECFASEKWLCDVCSMLREFIGHLEASDYAENVVGYQLCGGNTQEWFPFAENPAGGKADKEGFAAFIREKYPEEEGRYPESDTDLPAYTRYLEYLSYISSSAICRLSSYLKELTGRRVIVGCFYGYTLECPDPRLGHHGLDRVLACPDIDFIASPISYSEGRLPGTYMSYMSLTDSIRLHVKLYFSECDIRTHLSTYPDEARPGCVEPDTYRQPIWLGSSDPEIARAQVRAAFIKALTTESGLWWFDMWGGWFSDPAIMRDMAAFRETLIFAINDQKKTSISQVAVFIDENSYRLAGPDAVSVKNCAVTRRALGYTGTPYDIYSIADFASAANVRPYKAYIFLIPAMTEAVRRAIESSEKSGIGYICCDSENCYDAAALREFYDRNEVHIYCRSDDLIYVNHNYIGIYALSSGEKTMEIRKKKLVHAVLPDYGSGGSYRTPVETTKIKINMEKDRCRLFRLN
jgi:beta-galactosidase